MRKVPGFGNEKPVENNPYLNGWVIIYPIGMSRNFSGKVKEIDGNWAILNPFYGTGYIKKDGKILQRSGLVAGNCKVPITNAVIEPTMKKTLENFAILDDEKRNEKNNSKESEKI